MWPVGAAGSGKADRDLIQAQGCGSEAKGQEGDGGPAVHPATLFLGKDLPQTTVSTVRG